MSNDFEDTPAPHPRRRWLRRQKTSVTAVDCLHASSPHSLEGSAAAAGVPSGASSDVSADESSAAPADAPSGVSFSSSLASTGIVVAYLGDAAFTATTDGSVLPVASEYALALLKYIQKEEALHGRYVTSNALEMEFYPAFLDASGWAPRPWRPIAIALGKLTEKRPKEYRCAQRGKWKRKTVVQYFIPAPPKGAASLRRRLSCRR